MIMTPQARQCPKGDFAHACVRSSFWFRRCKSEPQGEMSRSKGGTGHWTKKTELLHRLRVDFLSGYRSSELYHEMNSVVDEMMGYLSHLLKTKEDIELFFQHLPRIISVMPRESEVTPLGHVHCYAAGVFETDARNAVSMSAFLEPFIRESAEEAGSLSYFHEYRPRTDNQPAHSNEGAKLRAVFDYRGVDELKKLCAKTGVNYERLRKESCYHGEIHGIPVFVSYALDEFSKKGSLELNILDPEDPYCITEASRAMARNADSFLKAVFKKKRRYSNK